MDRLKQEHHQALNYYLPKILNLERVGFVKIYGATLNLGPCPECKEGSISASLFKEAGTCAKCGFRDTLSNILEAIIDYQHEEEQALRETQKMMGTRRKKKKKKVRGVWK